MPSIESLEVVRFNPMLSLFDLEQELKRRQPRNLKYVTEELKRWALHTVESA